MIKKNIILIFFILLFFLVFIFPAYSAQDTVIQPVTYEVDRMFAITVSGNPSTLNITSSSTGGSEFLEAEDSSTSVGYTTILLEGETVNITVKYSDNDTLPSGTVLKLTAGSCQGGYSGTPGTPAGQITLSSSPQVLISAIGTCVTGGQSSNGHILNYNFAINNVSQLIAGDSRTITVILTITDI